MLDPHDDHSHDHDHGRCRHAALQRVERACAARGLKMTAPRRDVLDVLLAGHVPMSAYEIIDRMAERGRRPSPISVYRALDFLVGNGFAHRIESRNAFLACSHDHGPGDPAVVFLLCERCNVAEEAEPAELPAVIARIAAGTGFTVGSAVLELRGRCRRCREADEAPGETGAETGAEISAQALAETGATGRP